MIIDEERAPHHDLSCFFAMLVKYINWPTLIDYCGGSPLSKNAGDKCARLHTNRAWLTAFLSLRCRTRATPFVQASARRRLFLSKYISHCMLLLVVICC